MKEVTKHLGIMQIFASPYYPETNCLLECWHSTLKADAQIWQGSKGVRLSFLFGNQDATHEATSFLPFELLFDRQVCGPLDLVKEQWEETKHFPVSVGEYLTNFI